MWEDKSVLVLVKTAPHIIKSGRETVCTAGIDVQKKRWIRLYPIQFRELSLSKRFKKFQIIQLKARLDKSDIRRRPDSFKADQDSIDPSIKLKTAKDWGEINKLFFPLSSPSLECLQEANKKTGVSIGAFKPSKVESFEIKKYDDKKQVERLKTFQQSMFSQTRTVLKIPPFEYIYSFRCDDARCKSHKMRQTAWELTETARQWANIYKSDWKEQMKKRFYNYFFMKRDTWFIVGTNAMSGHFMLIGYYSPYRKSIQESLFDMFW